MFTLAHLSDVHLGPLPAARGLGDFFGKRAIGYCSWEFRRRKNHDPAIAEAMLADIRAHAPDHIAITGDLVNIALAGEFTRAAQWLKDAGPPSALTFVPGNHDTYVPVPWDEGAGLWADYMTGDLRVAATRPSPAIAAPMPFVRQRRNFALIGLSSAIPQSWRKAGGTLGPRQLEALAKILRDLRERGFCRVVLIHHPPLPGQNTPRKALTDAGELRAVLVAEGAELVLHGHNHRFMDARLGKTHIHGVPSATARGDASHPPAGWSLHRLQRKGSDWQIETSRRQWDAAAKVFVAHDGVDATP